MKKVNQFGGVSYPLWRDEKELQVSGRDVLRVIQYRVAKYHRMDFVDVKRLPMKELRELEGALASDERVKSELARARAVSRLGRDMTRTVLKHESDAALGDLGNAEVAEQLGFRWGQLTSVEGAIEIDGESDDVDFEKFWAWLKATEGEYSEDT